MDKKTFLNADQNERETVAELAFKYSGPLWDRYQVYRQNTPDLFPKSFDEWLET